MGHIALMIVGDNPLDKIDDCEVGNHFDYYDAPDYMTIMPKEGKEFIFSKMEYSWDNDEIKSLHKKDIDLNKSEVHEMWPPQIVYHDGYVVKRDIKESDKEWQARFDYVFNNLDPNDFVTIFDVHV